MQADIFLQKRDASHLERNALVGVFLRREFLQRPSTLGMSMHRLT
jgi:tRNA (Thr-GGU) A37 N-methylase